MPASQIAFPWASFLVFAFANCFTPGPNNLMSLSNAIEVGWVKNIPFSLGVSTAVFFLLILCNYFCAKLNSLINQALLIMKVLGAVYILFLAFSSLKAEIQINKRKPTLGYFNAMALQIVNPKIWIYCILVTETYLLQYYQPNPLLFTPQLIVLTVLPFVSNMAWSLCGSLFSMAFSKHKKLLGLIIFLLLIYCAVSILL